MKLTLIILERLSRLERYRYTDKEMKDIIDSMVILIDTREKDNEHITKLFKKHGILFERRKLEYGDYSFKISADEDLNIYRDMYFDKDVVIERKGSLEELSGNFTQSRERFEKEMVLAPKEKILLIENASYEDLTMGNYNTSYNKRSFLASLHKWYFKYNMPFVFMKDKNCSGVFIRYYFEYYLKNIFCP